MRCHLRLVLSIRIAAACLCLALLPVHAFARAQSTSDQTGVVATADTRAGLLPEPGFLRKALVRIEDFRDEERPRPKDGFYVASDMITGAGWISAGPGYRQHVLNDSALLDLSVAMSWRAYKVAQARFEFPYLAHEHFALGSQVQWQDLTQVRYFGLDADAVETPSDYRLRSTNVVTYAVWRPRTAVALTGTAGWLSRPELSSSTGPFDRDEPDTLALYANDPGAGLARQPRFFHSDVELMSDTRDHRGYPTRGGLYRASGGTFRDQSGGALTFNRFEAEGAQFVPVAGARGVLALHAWTVFSDTAPDRSVPFYFLPSLGGSNTLRAYTDYRFHGRNLAVVNFESRWALMDHVDAAFFFDAGNVAARVKDLDFARTSYGIGFRVHTRTSNIARIDFAHGDDGWRAFFRLNDPLRLRRLRRHTAPVPFVP